ncbi:TonB family protein [Sphingomonas ginsenosidivorax]|uniref:TonB family protein n=1 Tax=Sphingomonas ginsenosidivorax TaxID=862135 RepID=A0A5C6UEQ6_9SPHN|nr:TonB family protein [Sphingomonas ginsenosidivorax]TXC70616.1 TonB family protein [Sphingomonas ginsenosidivorax]
MPVALLALLSLPVPPPPSEGQRTDVVAFKATDVSCADGPVAAGAILTPFSAISTRYAAAGGMTAPTHRLTFVIDAQGHARTIRREPAPSAGWFVDTSDLAPALAASQFPVGAPRTGCSVRFTVSTEPLEAAAMPVLYELASRPETIGYPAALFERVRPMGSNCPRQPGQYRRLNMPPFETLPRSPGGPAWVFLAFDVDTAGKPGNVRVLGTSGNAALDRAGREALLANRYAPGGGYRGCTYHFFLNGGADHPAPDLGPDSPADTGDQPGCVIDPRSIRSLLDGSAYPRPAWRRRIEGVAVIAYDTAPWGAVGNPKILTSEPDDSFGNTARNILSNAQTTPSDTGRRGCVQRVRFKLPADGVVR